MFTQSIWPRFATIHSYPTLNNDLTADVAIVGGGITGISTAHLLAQRGYKVVVLESMKVGGGTTSHSTGNLYCTIDKNLSRLRAKYDVEVVQQVCASRSAAVQQIEQWVREHTLDCDFKRQPWRLYSAMPENDHLIEKEFRHAVEAQIPINRAEPSEFPLSVTKAVVVKDQAQINPMRYVQELARVAASDNCLIYENTRVQDLEEEDGKVKLTTSGGTVTAAYAVLATHTPKGIRMVQTLLGPYREYGIACRADGTDFPEGIFWGYHEKEKIYSSRLYERDGQRFVIVVGEPHKVGQADSNIEHIRSLEAFAKKHYGLTDVAYRWGGQHYRPADLLPYIGRDSSGSKVFIATGYSTDGLVYGTLSGMIIADDITGRDNTWADLYNAHRFQPLKSAEHFLKENINVAGQYLEVLTGKADQADFAGIKAGEGAVVKKEGQRIAASRSEAGELTLISAVCTHMKCIVHWNNAEKSWDCPCHGSRFKTDGTVLEGPAYEPLPKVTFEEEDAESTTAADARRSGEE